MAKSAALNPASMPFFPSGSRASDEDDRLSIAFSVSGVHEQDRAFMSSVSLSPSDRPSVKSSPSPSSEGLVIASSSPVSSLGSGGGQFISTMDYSSSFEAQLRASPVINDILERLARCEVSTREIHRNLNDVHRKVHILLDRSTGYTSQPEFKDPFATASAPSSISGPSSSMTRLSISGNLPPNQQPSDDIIQISQRLNTLTSSVG